MVGRRWQLSVSWIVASQEGGNGAAGVIGHRRGVAKPGGITGQRSKVGESMLVDHSLLVHKGGRRKFIKYHHDYRGGDFQLGAGDAPLTWWKYDLENRRVEEKETDKEQWRWRKSRDERLISLFDFAQDECVEALAGILRGNSCGECATMKKQPAGSVVSATGG